MYVRGAPVCHSSCVEVIGQSQALVLTLYLMRQDLFKSMSLLMLACLILFKIPLTPPLISL